MLPSSTSSEQPFSAVDAARLLCQEARVVLTSLRGGPPHIARGELAQDLMELRDRIPLDLERHLNAIKSENTNTNDDAAAGLTDSTDNNNSTDEAPVSAPVSSVDIVAMGPFPEASMDFSQPFLAVVTDPRASGPHTAVALQSIRRLVSGRALPANEGITRGILGCKFEQTNAGQDEAVEMAIADVLCLLMEMGASTMDPGTIHEALHTVFVTRNTFVHSPALVYHLEDVLVQMVLACQAYLPTTRVVLEFLIHHLLHTPLGPMLSSSGSSVDSIMDDSTRETQAAHDATRVLCLKLVRLTLQPWHTMELWNDEEKSHLEQLIPIIQDDLCLSLIMTGQAIWHYGTSANGGNGMHLVSPAVLTEICATVTFLWNCPSLRPHLMGPMEAIWTGFYTRALVLLRRRKEAVNAAAYHANLVFDAELEIILESLTDLLHLHDHSQTIEADGGGALETMFVYYDCHLQRSDVAIGLYVELCRACGGMVNEEGQALMAASSNAASGTASVSSLDGDFVPPDDVSAASSSGDPTTSLVQVDHPWRPVPAHLKELCAAAIMGGMKCLFRDDKASPQKLMERATRNRNITSSANNPAITIAPEEEEEESSEDMGQSHILRTIKSQKRFMRKAARIFNQKASRGIEFLVDCGLLSDPITPFQVATFLRHGIVVGLDKAAVGCYLGEAGKAKASTSTAIWERDWFHKECLEEFCGLFSFQGQSILDSLRMFLAAFRLPGEAQQIDRILQAFADKCASLCQEASTILSEDPKKASDAAYLLSFSIIMLNTDQHNANIRADRKMTVNDFVKNNTDYGKEITDPGKELPREYLESIYESIKEEQIRTEGEGADGAMTVERWKDVLRQARAASQAPISTQTGIGGNFHPSHTDAEDMTELVLEHVWKPILSAIGAFWNVSGRFPTSAGDDGVLASESQGRSSSSGQQNAPNQHAAMLGVQGARLGMDMSLEMLYGVRQLGRIDIFRKIFAWVCDYTGLLKGLHQVHPALLSGNEVANSLVGSVEAQSAVVVAIRTAVEAGEDLNIDGWKRFWAIMLELRDSQVLPSRLLKETDTDFLRPSRRREWNEATLDGDMKDIVADVLAEKEEESRRNAKPTSVFGMFGRAIFGSDEPDTYQSRRDAIPRTGKEEAVIWDETALSDNELDNDDEVSAEKNSAQRKMSLEAELGDELAHLSPGAIFEAQLIRESIDINEGMETPVTGLETAEETKQKSPRSRLRNRFEQACHLDSFVSDTRFLDDESIKQCLIALMDLVPTGPQQPVIAGKPTEIDPSNFSTPTKSGMGDRSMSDVSIATPSFISNSNWSIPVSPASEAFAEVLICEIALKNRDRLKMLWSEFLRDHYVVRLAKLMDDSLDDIASEVIEPDPGLEKRVTGLLRLSVYSTMKGDVANQIISCWKEVLPIQREQQANSPLNALHRHISEGLNRILTLSDNLCDLNEYGWEGLMALIDWCATRSCSLPPVRKPSSPLPEDDPAVQTYRSLHLLLNAAEIQQFIPCDIVACLRTLVAAGDTRNYPQLSVASLDLLQLLHQKKLPSLEDGIAKRDEFCTSCWRRIVESMAEAAEHPKFSVSTVESITLSRRSGEIPHNLLSACICSRMFDNTPCPCSQIYFWINKMRLYHFRIFAPL